MKNHVTVIGLLLLCACCAPKLRFTSASQLRNEGSLSADFSSPTGNLVLVSSNYTWAENLWFDDVGHMYVSDLITGTVFRLSTQTGKNATESGAFPAIKERWAGSEGGKYSRVLGQQFLDGTLFVVAQFASGSKQRVILNVSTAGPDMDTVWANTSCLGNGLSLLPPHSPTVSNTLFTCCEKDFIPVVSKILALDTSATAAGSSTPPTVFQDDMWAADGAYFYEPENLLFISESLPGVIKVYNMSALNSQSVMAKNIGPAVLIRSYTAPGTNIIDDFCVVRHPKTGKATMIASDFMGGRVIMLDVSLENTIGNHPPTEHTVLATGLTNPTSVRPGMGPYWSGPGLFYVSEGSLLAELDHSLKERHIWQLTVDW